jgi:hypothetical protein
MLTNGPDNMDVALGDWSKLRTSIQTEKNRELKDYKDMSKKDIKDAFSFLRQWALALKRTAGFRVWDELLQRLLWKQHEDLTPVPEAKKERYSSIIVQLSFKIRLRYAQEFQSLSKFGGIPMVFRDEKEISDLFALVLVRSLRNDEEKVIEQLTETVVSGVMDPCRAFFTDVNLRQPQVIATDMFLELEANSVGISAERFVRRVAGAAAAAVLRGVDEGVIDLKVYPGVDEHMRITFRKRMRTSLPTYYHYDEKHPKRVPDPTYGVARNAPRLFNEHRITVQFDNPPAKVHAHVPVGIPMDKLMDFITKTYPDVAAMLLQRSGSHSVYWQDPDRFNCPVYRLNDDDNSDWRKPDMFTERHASTGVLRTVDSIYLTLDALPIAELTNTVNFDTARQTVHKMLDALTDTPFFEFNTRFCLQIPNCQSGFENKYFSIKPRAGLLVKYMSFKDKLAGAIAKMKSYADKRLDLHSTEGKWYSVHSYMKSAELAFYRNVSKSRCTVEHVVPKPS